ncbi:MAG: hypothetical protein HW387_1037 [Parachlamydiales bacterium]|nr:hypothetical protein [Parachlamydiales bacterium]
MTDHFIEIVFKDVSVEKIESLIKDLSLNGQRVVSYNITCNSVKISWDTDKSIERIFTDNNNFGLFLNLDELKKDGICLPNCGIAVYKNENEINVELNFRLSDLKNFKTDNLVKKLMKLSKSIAAQYHINDYFCGLEPAQDIETRLFSKEQTGPLFLKE